VTAIETGAVATADPAVAILHPLGLKNQGSHSRPAKSHPPKLAVAIVRKAAAAADVAATVVAVVAKTAVAGVAVVAVRLAVASLQAANKMIVELLYC
jgi:hypothetical protein